MVDLKCPKCGSDDTRKLDMEIFDSNIKKLWWTVIIFGLLGITIHPVIMFLVVFAILLTVAVNIVKKHSHRNEWVMQCSRCGYQFSVINPDKEESIKTQKVKQDTRQREKWNNYTEKNKKIIEGLNRNGQLEDDETLLYTVDYFSPHRKCYTSSSRLKITDKSLVCYNEKKCLRISRKDIISIKKKNYFLVIPTGIQIYIKENGKHKKYNFVVMSDERKDILNVLKNSEKQ